MINLVELNKWKDVITPSGIWSDGCHALAWSITKGLAFLVDSTEHLVSEVYTFLDFTKLTVFQNFFGSANAKALLMVLFSVAVLGLAGFYTFNHGDKKPQIMQNAITFLLILFVLPSAMDSLNKMTMEVNNMDILQADTAQSTAADTIISNGVTDLLYIDKKGFQNYTVDGSAVTGNGVSKNAFSRNTGNIRYIDVNEVITGDTPVNNKDYLFNEVEPDENGRLQAKPIEKETFLGLDFTPWVYRYKIDFFSIIITLAASAIAFCFVAFKVVKLIYELAISPIIAVITGASDMMGGQKVKEAIKNIVASYAVLMLIPVLMKVYFLAQAFIVDTFSNMVVRTFLLVSCAIALIDGPNLIQRIFGIDAGMKSAFQTLASAFMISRSVGAMGKKVSGMAKSAAGGAVGFGQAVKDRHDASGTKGSDIVNANSSDHAENSTQNDAQTNLKQDNNQTAENQSQNNIKEDVNQNNTQNAQEKNSVIDGSAAASTINPSGETAAGNSVNDSISGKKMNDQEPVTPPSANGAADAPVSNVKTPNMTGDTASGSSSSSFTKGMNESLNEKGIVPPPTPTAGSTRNGAETPTQQNVGTAEKAAASPVKQHTNNPSTAATRGYDNWTDSRSPYNQGKRRGYKVGSVGRNRSEAKQEKKDKGDKKE